ncbi:MAG: hypothetical protein Q9227_007746 [Pyrenula ochraceoflavens]
MSLLTEARTISTEVTLTTSTTLFPGQTPQFTWSYPASSTVVSLLPTGAHQSTPSAGITTTVTITTSQSTTSLQQPGTTASNATSSSTANQSNSTHSLTPDHHSNDVSSGAAAGIGIGCAIVGALLASILVLLFMRNRSRSSPTERRAGDLSLEKYSDNGRTKAGGATNIAMQEKAADSSLLAALPLPVPEREIGDNFSKLGSAVKNHAKSYYNGSSDTEASNRNSSSSQDLERLLGPRCPISKSRLENLLSNPNCRLSAIRFLIAWAIVCNIQPGKQVLVSLLPPELAQVLATIFSVEIREDSDRQKLLGRWRQISGALLQPTYGDGSVRPNDTRQRNVRDLTNALNTVLEPYAASPNDIERARNLEELVKRGARFGYLLFTQPTAWNFVWDETEGRRQSDWVVFPSLVQVCDDQGRSRQPPIRYAEPQVVQLSR